MDLGASFPVQREASAGPRPTHIDSRIAELEEPDWSNSTPSAEPQWRPSQIGFEESETFPANEVQSQPRDNPFRSPGSFDELEEAPGRVKL